jgi:hypothetical protein
MFIRCGNRSQVTRTASRYFLLFATRLVRNFAVDYYLIRRRSDSAHRFGFVFRRVIDVPGLITDLRGCCLCLRRFAHKVGRSGYCRLSIASTTEMLTEIGDIVLYFQRYLSTLGGPKIRQRPSLPDEVVILIHTSFPHSEHSGGIRQDNGIDRVI